MPPTYTSRAIETIHQGEQLFTVDSHHNEAMNSLSLEVPHERARPPFSRRHTYGKKPRSGSPQVHPSLKASSVVDEARRTGSTPSSGSHLRRNVSADFSTMRDTSTEPLGGGDGGRYRVGSDDDATRQVKELKQARLSPPLRRPAPLRAMSDYAPDIKSKGTSGSSGSKGKEQWNEYRLEAASHDGLSYEKSTDRPMDAQRYLDGGSQSESADYLTATGGARRSSWCGPDDTFESPSVSSSSPASSQLSSPSSFASSHATLDTEVNSTSHELDGQATVRPCKPRARSCRRRSADSDCYGTPEMPRGSANLPRIPTDDLAPRAPSYGHPKHLPRAEKLPMSGYELLASTISSSPVPTASRNRVSAFLETTPAAARTRDASQRRHSSASTSSRTGTTARGQPVTAVAPALDEEPTIRPIYRRFESLHHRLLLHLQDELSELEEQLHRLDTTDTQTRRSQTSIIPASRRAECLAGGELQAHKSEILSKIASKLGQYNNALSSFTSTRDLPAPALSAVTEYRDYLDRYRPISDVETRFLDSTGDLITLESPVASHLCSPTATSADDLDHRRNLTRGGYLRSLHLPPNDDEQTIVTPIPGTMHGNSWLVRHNRLPGSRGSSAPSSSPRFARHYLGASDTLNSPRLPPSPLRNLQVQRPEVSSDAEDAKRSPGRKLPALSLHAMALLALALAMAVMLPVLTFSVVPGFAARMIVSLLIGLSVVGSLAKAVEMKRVVGSMGDLMCSGAVYAGVMAILAGVMA